MRDLLILPNLLDAADKLPPKESAHRAGLKTNSTAPFQHVFEQSSKMVQKQELKPQPKESGDDTEETAQSDRVRNTSDQLSAASQSETATLPLNHPDNNPIQSNTISDGKEGNKDEQINLDNSMAKTKIKTLNGNQITLAGAKITFTTDTIQGDPLKGVMVNNGNLTTPAMSLVNGSDQADIQTQNITTETTQPVDADQNSKQKEFTAELKQPQAIPSNSVLNPSQQTIPPEEQKGGDVNLKVNTENGEIQPQNVNEASKGVNSPEISANSNAESNTQGISPQPTGQEPLQTSSLNMDSRFVVSTGDTLLAKDGQKNFDANEPGSKGQNVSAAVVYQKSNTITNVGINTTEQGKAFVAQASGSAPMEGSLAGKTTIKPKEDPPPENIQTGVPQPVIPQNKTTEPARLAEAPRNEVIQQLSKDLESFTKSGQQSLRLQLHPESLGKIDLHLTSNEGGVRIVMNADQAATGFMLERHLGELREMLEQAGVNLTGLSVNSGNAQSHSNGNFQNSSFYSANFSSKNHSLMTNQEKKDLPTQPRMDHDSRVDYRI